MRLPEAFRSLPRLSSAPSAKAFSLCSFLLDQFNIAISLECFVVAIQLLLHLKIENFVFSIDSIFALLVFSFQGASCFEGLILQNRTMNIFHNLALKNVYEKPFVYLSAMLIAVRNPEEPGPSVWPLSRSLAAT